MKDSQKPSPVFAGLLDKDLVLDFSNAFEQSERSFVSLKNAKKIPKFMENNEVEAIVLDENRVSETIKDTTRAIKSASQNCQIYVLQNTPTSLKNDLFDIEEIDHVVPKDASFDRLFQRLAKNLGLKTSLKLDGKSGILSARLTEVTEGWSTFGEAFHVVEGISLRHPELHLHNKRSSDKEVPFLKNGQVKAYCITGHPLYWLPDEDVLHATPAKTLLQMKEKLIVHHMAPPFKAAIDREGYLAGPSHYLLAPKADATIEEACCLLNSRVIDFYMHKMFTPNKEGERLSSNIRAMDIKNLPLPPDLNNPYRLEIKEELLEVDLLLKSGAGPKHPRILELMASFDQLVFKWFRFDQKDISLLKELYF